MLCAEPVINTITIQQCFNLAQANNEQARISAEHTLQALQQLHQARGTVLPDVYFRYRKTFQDSAAGDLARETSETKLTATQPLFDGFKKYNALKIASGSQRSAQLIYQEYLRALRQDVAVAYFSVLQNEYEKKNTEEAFAVWNTRLNELKKRIELGKSRPSEALLIESSIATLRSQLAKNTGDAAIARERLSFIVGTDMGSAVFADDAAVPESAESLEAYAAKVSHRPDILALQEAVLVAQMRLRAARGDFLPAIDLNASRYLERDTKTLRNDWDVVFSLDMPISQGGQTAALVKENSSKLREAELALSYAQREAITETRVAYHAFVSSLEQSREYGLAYDKTTQSYKAQLREYSLGLVNNLEVLDVMRQLLDVKQRFDSARLDAQRNKILLDIITGE
ncbi:MAG: TolC family protein [bacterium]